MSDRIEVRGLRVLGRHGANPGEQDQPQPFELDLLVRTDLRVPARADDIEVAVDYGALVEEARRIVAALSFHLLEALAEAICQSLLADPRIASVTVVVRKLRPPLAADVGSVGVRVTRNRLSNDQHGE